MIKFNQKYWLKAYIKMNTKLRRKAKTNFEKDFFKLMNNMVFGKTIKNARKNNDIKLLSTERRKKFLVSEPNYHTAKRAKCKMQNFVIWVQTASLFM